MTKSFGSFANPIGNVADFLGSITRFVANTAVPGCQEHLHLCPCVARSAALSGYSDQRSVYLTNIDPAVFSRLLWNTLECKDS